MHGKAQLQSEPLDWWLRYPGLLQSELAAFDKHGAATKIAHQKDGYLILEVDWSHSDPVRLRVGYSPFHPYSRAHVSAPEIELARHQDPVFGTLCLLTQESGEWRPNERVADLIAEQLPKVFEAALAHAEDRREDARSLEEHAPDPLSNYFVHQAEEHSVVIFDAQQAVPATGVGIAKFTLRARPFGPETFEAVLRSVEPLNGKNWLAPPFTPWKSLEGEALVMGRWVRLTPSAADDADSLFAAAETAIGKAVALQPRLRRKMDEVAAGAAILTLIVFDEEVEYGRNGPGCLFVVSRRRPSGLENRLIRGLRYAPDVLARVTVAESLQSKSALLVGAGAIGSFVAQDLVRAGLGRLEIIDGDRVEPGNGVRWALGREVWGLPKAHALQFHLARNYPAAEVKGYFRRLGATVSDIGLAQEADHHPVAWLRELVAKTNVVVDASASTECQQALALLCREMGKPYIMGHATEGAAGGVVARFDPDQAGCRVCLDEHWHDRSLPIPPVDPAGTMTPVGCNAPTFTGGAFDVQEVSLELVRSAIEVLAPGARKSGNWSLATLELVDGANRILPRWTTTQITPHPRCSGCSSR